MPLPQLDYKKVLIITGFTLVSLGLAFFIVWLFFLSGDEAPAPPDFIAGIDNVNQLPESASGSGSGGSALPPAGPGGGTAAGPLPTAVAQGGPTTVLPVNTDRVLAPVPAREGRDVAFYDPARGQFFRLAGDGSNLTLLTDETFFSVQSVTWSQDKSKAVLEYPDGANIIYDFTKRSRVTLPPESVEHQFAPVSQNLAFKIETENPENNWLVVTDSKGGNPKFIEPVGNRGELVQVAFSPNEEVVALYHKPISPSQSEIFLLGQSGENFKSFIVDGLNFQGKFSPDGRRLLYQVVSTQNGFKPEIWIIDVRGQNVGLNKFNLNLETWIDKCVFSGNNQEIYCAVPRHLTAGVGLTPGSEFLTDDVFYQVNLETGLKRLLAEPVTEQGTFSVSVSDIWLDKTAANLFFWDANTGQVFRLRLE